jgi:hypothetical protein
LTIETFFLRNIRLSGQGVKPHNNRLEAQQRGALVNQRRAQTPKE